MKAITFTEFGGPEVLQLSDLPRPTPGPGQVLVRVRASSVNPVDTKIRSGLLAAIAPENRVLGCDMAGVIEKIGPDVREFAVGDEVFGCATGVRGCGGALAEYLVADARLIARKPATLTFEQAAALPLVSITAWEGLIDRAKIAAGQSVLIHGGTGGVGHLAVQLAIASGARVWSTVSSPAKAEIVRQFGAEPIFYRDASVAEYVAAHTGGAGFDLVMDTVGGENVAQSLAAAAINGTVVSISTRTTADLTVMHQRGLTLHVVFMLIPMLFGRGRERHGEILCEIAKLADQKKIHPLIDPREFTFAETAQAHAALEAKSALGKIVLRGF